ncbi:MAG: LysM peptidoglycan-binding domain-containing protein, partial [Gemmatimonadota bacterium]
RYGVPVSDLTDMNGSVDPRRLQNGTRLVVPVGGVDGDMGARLASNAVPVRHIVSSGENLWTIARRYGVSTRELARENGRALDDVIQIGDQLLIPGTSPST